MKAPAFIRCGLAFITLITFSARAGEIEACSAAVSEFNALKERIAVGFSTDSKPARDDLRVVAAKLENITDNCSSSPILPEVWAYWVKVLEHLNLGTKSWQQDLKHARNGRDKLKYQSLFFNPSESSLGAAADDTAPARAVHKKWALVVGINEFTDASVPPLNYAAKDAADFSTFLAGQAGFKQDQIQLVTNQQATLSGIRAGIGWLRQRVGPDDMVVLYFSSHGSPRDADPNGVSYIITHDTSLESPATLYATSLQMIDLVLSVTRELKSRRIVLVLDTCYSGDAQSKSGEKGIMPVYSAGTDPAPFSAALVRLKIGYGRAVLTASRADETSRESGELDGGRGNGYFTRFLIDALRDNPARSLGEVFGVVQQRVAEAARTQHPTSVFSDHGSELLLTVPES